MPYNRTMIRDIRRGKMNNRFYTPDGFCDTMPGVCAFKREAEAKLRGLFSTHGYSEIETPGIEYCDVIRNLHL